MGREVRMVPADWEHPKQRNGNHKPLHGDSYAKTAREWLDNVRAWDDGTHETLQRHPEYKAAHPFWWEWDGGSPDPEDYMPDWPAEQRTHYQMYETCSEGTPLSPPMPTPEALARYLADTGASAFGYDTATYEAWLATIRRGSAPSAMMTGGGPIVSGVTALAAPDGGDPR